MWTNKWE